MIFRGLEPRDWPEVSNTLQLVWSEGLKGVVCEEDGELLGVMVCHSWTETSVQGHVWIADKRALKHRFHYECMRYVFTTANREKMIGIIPSDNEKALKFDRHLGFSEVARIKDAFSRGVDAVIMELHRDDCPYWEPIEEAA